MENESIMSEQISGLVTHEPRWTQKRLLDRVAERKAESKVRGGTEEGREATFVHMATVDMRDDYETTLADLRLMISYSRNQVSQVEGICEVQHKTCNAMPPASWNTTGELPTCAPRTWS